jgi:hypothetical protein
MFKPFRPKAKRLSKSVARPTHSSFMAQVPEIEKLPEEVLPGTILFLKDKINVTPAEKPFFLFFCFFEWEYIELFIFIFNH